MSGASRLPAKAPIEHGELDNLGYDGPKTMLARDRLCHGERYSELSV